MKQTLKYASDGRSGRVIYQDVFSELSFYFEFGGGNCVAIIDIPGPKKWEKETKRALADRESIVQFIAEKCRQDQVPDGYYKISDNYIEFFK